MTTNDVSIYSTGDYARGMERTLTRGVGGLNRSAGGHCTTERPVAERTGSGASQHFCERVRQLERRWDTYKLCEFPEVVLTHKHIAQVEVLDAIVAAIVARQFLASLVVFVNDSGAILGEAHISEQAAEPDIVF